MEKSVAETAKPAVEALLQNLLRWLEGAEEFALEQMPLVAEEIILWGMAYHLTNTLLAFGFLIVAFFLGRKAYDWSLGEHAVFDNYSCLSPKFLVPLIPGIVAGSVGAPLFFNSLLSVLKVVLAPRLYLIEYLQKLV